MSINNKGNLKEVAKLVCRELRNKSTKPEKIFWELVRKKRFFGRKFYRQYPFLHDITGEEAFLLLIFFVILKK